MSEFVTLEETLRSSRAKLPPEELKLLWKCKNKAVKDFTVSSFVAAAATYAASSIILKNKVLRLSLAGGVGCVGGFWYFSRSLSSSANYLLSLDGSQIQKELANIIVKHHPNDEVKMKILARHFYSERVFDDSNLDLPKLRWRYRNFFSDTSADGQRSQESHSDADSHSNAHSDNRSGSYKEPQKVSHNKLGGKSTGLHSIQTSGISVTDVVEYPLDCLFGSPAAMEEVNYNSSSSTSPRKLSRSNRRSQRKQRRLLREASLNS